jgi:hypothetical protein
MSGRFVSDGRQIKVLRDQRVAFLPESSGYSAFTIKQCTVEWECATYQGVALIGGRRALVQYHYPHPAPISFSWFFLRWL